MIKLYPHFGFFELYNKHKPDWICIHALELHSQMHTEAFQEIRRHMCSTHDIKSVNEIRGGAWVEQRQPSPRCSFRNSCHGPPHLTSLPHLVVNGGIKCCYGLSCFSYASHQYSLSDVHSTSSCIYTPAVFTHARSFILASSSPFSERSLSFFFQFTCCPSILVFSHTPKTHTLDWDKPNNLDSVFRFRILIQSNNLLELLIICMGRADATLRFFLFCSFYKGRDMISDVSVNLWK